MTGIAAIAAHRGILRKEERPKQEICGALAALLSATATVLMTDPARYFLGAPSPSCGLPQFPLAVDGDPSQWRNAFFLAGCDRTPGACGGIWVVLVRVV